MIAGPIVLVKPFDSLPQDHALDAEKMHQREMHLCLCLEQRWTKFLSRCANEWSDGSAAYLYPEFILWGVQRASELKLDEETREAKRPVRKTRGASVAKEDEAMTSRQKASHVGYI